MVTPQLRLRMGLQGPIPFLLGVNPYIPPIPNDLQQGRRVLGRKRRPSDAPRPQLQDTCRVPSVGRARAGTGVALVFGMVCAMCHLRSASMMSLRSVGRGIIEDLLARGFACFHTPATLQKMGKNGVILLFGHPSKYLKICL